MAILLHLDGAINFQCQDKGSLAHGVHLLLDGNNACGVTIGRALDAADSGESKDNNILALIGGAAEEEGSEGLAALVIVEHLLPTLLATPVAENASPDPIDSHDDRADPVGVE